MTIAFLIFIFIISLYFMFSVERNTYLYKNNYCQIRNKPDFENRDFLDGIEVRVLSSSHLLSGQKGVFATKKF
jgi:hypothetical protein